MASGFSTTKRNSILTAEFKTASRYGACCTADPGDAGNLVANEVAAAHAYARTVCTCVTDAAAGSISNTTAVEFPAASGGAHGLVSHLALCVADVEGVDDMVASGALTASKQIDDGDQLVFAIGNITASIAAQA